jgi:hypothetical protein
MNEYRGLLEDQQKGRRGKEGILRGEEDRSILHMYILTQYNETHQTLRERGLGGGMGT